MTLNPDIFRKYDIRGIAETDLDDDTIFKLGRAFATFAASLTGGAVTIGVGRDMRESSPRLFEALSNGLRASGGDVIDLGMVPTPVVYFARHNIDSIDACIMITGSHNPGDYNGFKMVVGAQTLHSDHIQTLKHLIETEDFAQGDGELRSIDDLIDRYIEWCAANLDFGPHAGRYALDCGNGVTGVMAQRFVDEVLPGEAEVLFEEPDGSFPNHHPDPTVEANLADLIATVRENSLDFGVSYDGDGDRLGVVDEDGTVVWGDKLMILFSRAVLEVNPGATIIGEVKCSQTLFDDITAHGGNAIMSAVGHSLIKEKIKETDAHLAGEMSGHIFFNDRFFGFDDALYATGRLLEIVSATEKSVSELLADVPETFATPEIRRECDEQLKFEIPGEVAAHFEELGHDVNTIDGARINFGDGWGLVRASNTQPVLVLRVEAKSAERRDALLKSLEKVVESAETRLS